MRIISGKYKSRRIHTPGGKGGQKEHSIKANLSGFRPTTDRAKETLFNVLNNIIDFDSVTCLDLFAGTGALGLEALSRGASECAFIDSSEKHCLNIQKTAAELGCSENAEIIRSDALKFLLENENNYFDIIFADPPYTYESYNELVAAVLNLKFAVFAIEYGPEGGFMYNLNEYEILDKKVGVTNFKIFITKE